MSELENVASGKMDSNLKDQLPNEVEKFLEVTQGASDSAPLDLNSLAGIFKDSAVLDSLKSSGIAVLPNMQKGGDVVIGAGFNTKGQMVTTAAAVPRNPGRSEDYLREVADFSAANADRTTMLDLYDRVYSREGIVNNAINKCLPKDCPVQLGDGAWTTLGELSPGDVVLGVDQNGYASPTEVLAVHDSGVKEVWRIEFQDGSHLRVTDEHIIPVLFGHSTRPVQEISVRELRYRYENYSKVNWAMPFRAKAIEFAPRDEPLVSGYAMGAMLGDGYLGNRKLTFTSAEPEIPARMNEDLMAVGYEVRKLPREYSYSIAQIDSRPGHLGELRAELRRLELEGHTARDKFIPEEYKYGSIETRMQLLAGLMDTDGSSNGGFVTSSSQLADDVVDVVRSLGGWSSKRVMTSGEAWHVRVGLEDVPVVLERKKVTRRSRSYTMGIKAIVSEGMQEVGDISVGNDTHWFLANGIVVHNSAALIAMDGEFKVRYVKGKRGVSSDQRAEELRKLLQFWQENVNARTVDGAVKGDRGLRTFMAQGVRLVLKQGDHFGRQMWSGIDVPVLGKPYELPMSLQTFDARTIEIPDGLEGTDIELYYWVPPREFVQMLQNPRDPNVKEYLDKAIPSEVQSELIANGQFLLDPELMIHIKHRGTATSNFGESMVEPALNEIAYKRALQALDIVTIENLINRLVIIMVGSDDPNSIYHKQEVSSSRMAMMSNMLRRVGPAATIIWPGPDIEVKEVGAYNKVLEMDERYKQAELRIRNALGVPSALLTGDTSGGKAAGWAAIVGLAAELSEIQEQYKQVFRTIAERIALENGFEDVDVVWEFNQALLTDKSQHVDMVLQMAKTGIISIHTMLSELGFSFETEEVRMGYDVEMGYREMPFGPLRALENNMSNESGDSPEGEDGRPESPNEEDPREDTETRETEERT